MVVNSIAVCHTIWNVSVHICSKALKAFQKNVGSCHSVNIVIPDNPHFGSCIYFPGNDFHGLVNVLQKFPGGDICQGSIQIFFYSLITCYVSVADDPCNYRINPIFPANSLEISLFRGYYPFFHSFSPRIIWSYAILI